MGNSDPLPLFARVTVHRWSHYMNSTEHTILMGQTETHTLVDSWTSRNRVRKLRVMKGIPREDYYWLPDWLREDHKRVKKKDLTTPVLLLFYGWVCCATQQKWKYLFTTLLHHNHFCTNSNIRIIEVLYGDNDYCYSPSSTYHQGDDGWVDFSRVKSEASGPREGFTF